MCRAIIGAALASLVFGCAAPSQRTYINPFLHDKIAEKRQFAIDDGYCTKAAAGSVPIPAVRTYSPGQESYTVRGSGSAFNPNSGFTSYDYSSHVTARRSPAQAFASGFANGMNIGAAMQAREAQEKIYNGCMVSLGWATSEEEAQQMREAAQEKRSQASERLQETIDSIPELARWQASDARMWDLAVVVDNELKASREWGNVPARLRFLEVVRRVKSMTASH